jgi:hypothetical protein
VVRWLHQSSPLTRSSAIKAAWLSTVASRIPLPSALHRDDIDAKHTCRFYFPPRASMPIYVVDFYAAEVKRFEATVADSEKGKSPRRWSLHRSHQVLSAISNFF